MTAQHNRCQPEHVTGAHEPAKIIYTTSRDAILNDLHVFALFARVDEEYFDLRDANFVWTAAVVTDECLSGLTRESTSDVLRWREIHSWWGCLPHGAYDVTTLLRAVRLPGW